MVRLGAADSELMKVQQSAPFQCGSPARPFKDIDKPDMELSVAGCF
jgi:hypothetical protein